MTEYENEPIPGLPGLLPPGERIVWQGAPDWRVLARTAFHTRAVAGYFALLAGLAFLNAADRAAQGAAAFTGVGATLAVGALGLALLHLLAWASARSTMYTLTNRRVVMRIGIALPKCINLPLTAIGAVDLRLGADGAGDLPLALTGQQRIGYAGLWPHARPWKIGTPQPMLRALPEAAEVAALLARTCLAANPDGRMVPVAAAPADVDPGFAGAAAA